MYRSEKKYGVFISCVTSTGEGQREGKGVGERLKRKGREEYLELIHTVV